MSFLDRLKTKLADEPGLGSDDPGRAFMRYAHASGGFEGASGRGFSGNEGDCGGFEGRSGGHISQPGGAEYPYKAPENPSLELLKSRLEKQVHAQARGQTCPPEAPSKLSEALAALAGTVTLDHVRAGVERELRALTALGVTGSDAERRAVAITRAKIGNSEAFAERSVRTGRCQQCEETLDDSLPVIAVMGGRPDRPLFMHDGCHAAFRARRIALIEALMAAAGYGVELEGRAA